jgi:hypothetical protein
MQKYAKDEKGCGYNFRRGLRSKITEETEVKPEIVKMGLKELLDRLGMETELKEKRIIDKRKA